MAVLTVPIVIFIFLTKYYIKQTNLGYWKVVSVPFKTVCVINCLLAEIVFLIYIGRAGQILNLGDHFYQVSFLLTLWGMVALIPAVLLSTVIYYFPYLRAYEKDCPSISRIFVYNLLFGWTFVGWILLIFISNRYLAADSKVSYYDVEIDDKLIELNRKLEQGLLTEYEYKREKDKLESMKSIG